MTATSCQPHWLGQTDLALVATPPPGRNPQDKPITVRVPADLAYAQLAADTGGLAAMDTRLAARPERSLRAAGCREPG